VLCCVTASHASERRLPLGPRELEELRTTREVAPGVTWTSIVRGRVSRGGVAGPWRVQVLRIGAGARLAVALSNERVPGRQSVSEMATAQGAIAAVNGGFFGSQGIFDGDPIGALALAGALVSEPVAGRASLLLPPPDGGLARVAGLRFAGEVEAAGLSRLLDGVNRARGLIASCGGRGGDRPSERPGATRVCADPSELVMLTPAFGARTRTDEGGVEAVVRGTLVTRVREGGNSRIPTDGYVLSGSGDAATFLRAMEPGTAPAVDLTLRAGGRRLRPGSWEAIVGGGPRLLKRGRRRVRTVAEGFSSSFASRNPRTLAGVTRRGDVLLVTVDGRQPRHSVGVTLVEAARLMRSLGARDALNLDGGGSSAMFVGGRVVNRPSDGMERAVSDAIVVVPR
jgi:Phosphodiester glycosidase